MPLDCDPGIAIVGGLNWQRTTTPSAISSNGITGGWARNRGREYLESKGYGTLASAWATGSRPPRASSCWNGRTSPRCAENGTTPSWRCYAVAASGAARLGRGQVWIGRPFGGQGASVPRNAGLGTTGRGFSRTGNRPKERGPEAGVTRTVQSTVYCEA